MTKKIRTSHPTYPPSTYLKKKKKKKTKENKREEKEKKVWLLKIAEWRMATIKMAETRTNS